MTSINDLINKRNVYRGGKLPPVRYAGVKKNTADVDYNLFAVWLQYNSRVTGPAAKNVPKKYNTVFIFKELYMGREQSKKTPIRIDISPGYTQWMERPSCSSTRVSVSCTCPDYFWCWSYYNRKYRVQSGTDFVHPSEVTGRKTRKSDNKPYGSAPDRSKINYDPRRNPLGIVGVCKHIVDGSKQLKKMGWIKE